MHFLCCTWRPSFIPKYLWDAPFSSSCIVVHSSIEVLSFVFPWTNVHFVHLVHLSSSNSILMSSDYCFTSFSWFEKFLSFGAISFRSTMFSRCVTFLFLWSFFCCMSGCICVVNWWGYSEGPEPDKWGGGKDCHLVRYIGSVLLGFQSFLPSKIASTLCSRATLLSQSLWLFGVNFVFLYAFYNPCMCNTIKGFCIIFPGCAEVGLLELAVFEDGFVSQ